MILPLLRDILHTPVVEIIQRLKQSPGMTVKELSSAMEMSYMGVKQHCDAMVKKGYFDTWRHPVPHGRPEKVYRLTTKLDPLFPIAGCDLLLELLGHAERVFGPTAAEKLLYAYFQSRAETCAERVAAETEWENKLLVLARLRSAEGTLSVVERASDGALRLIDHHHPLAPLAKKYPRLETFEVEMIERVLGVTVERTVEQHSGLKRTIYRLRI